jgi:hypothetical protein
MKIESNYLICYDLLTTEAPEKILDLERLPPQCEVW